MARIFILTSFSDADTGNPVYNVDDCGKLSLDSQRAPLILRWGVCIGYGSYIIFNLIFDLRGSWHLFWHNGGLLPIMLLIVAGSAVGADPIARHVFAHPIPKSLSQLSFAQYLLQFPLHTWMYVKCISQGYKQKVHDEEKNAYYYWPDGQNVAYIPLLLIFAYLTNRFIQRPYTEWQNWRAEKKIKGCDEILIEKIDAFVGTLPSRLRALGSQRSQQPQSEAQSDPLWRAPDDVEIPQVSAAPDQQPKEQAS